MNTLHTNYSNILTKLANIEKEVLGFYCNQMGTTLSSLQGIDIVDMR